MIVGRFKFINIRGATLAIGMQCLLISVSLKFWMYIVPRTRILRNRIVAKEPGCHFYHEITSTTFISFSTTSTVQVIYTKEYFYVKILLLVGFCVFYVLRCSALQPILQYIRSDYLLAQRDLLMY